MKKICTVVFFCICILFCQVDVFATDLSKDGSVVKSLEERLVSSWKRKDTSIYIADYGILEEDIMDYYVEVLYKHPELYYVVSEISIYKLPNQSHVFVIAPKYIETEWGDGEWVLDVLDKPLSLLDENMTTVEKILFLHDYLCVNVEYADELVKKDEHHSILGIVTEGKAVCDGYAKAFQYYMNKLEIPCCVIQGDNHVWNQVEIDGQWYMIDVTHDDPTPDEYGRVMHTYFLKSESQMGERTWKMDGYQVCDSTVYDNAFWNNVQTQMLYKDGSWYYINGKDDEDMHLYRYNFNNHSLMDQGEVCVKLAEKWINSGQTRSYWFGSYGKIAQYQDKMIYSTPAKIFWCTFDGKNVECIVNELEKEQSIYGMKIVGDQLIYQLAQSPKHEKQEVMISMKRQPLSVGTIIYDEESKSSYQIVYSNFAGGAVVYKKNIERNATSVVVPERIQVEGRYYRVVAIDKKAFFGHKKMSDVRLPRLLTRKINRARKRNYLLKNNGRGL